MGPGGNVAEEVIADDIGIVAELGLHHRTNVGQGVPTRLRAKVVPAEIKDHDRSVVDAHVVGIVEDVLSQIAHVG